jgi:curved DNA-binding protein CbpA
MDNLNRYYEILGLRSGASLDEIKQAYKDLVNVWHPDRFGHNSRLQEKASEKLKEINLAYEELVSSYEEEPSLANESSYEPPKPPPPPQQYGTSSQGNSKANESWGVVGVYLLLLLVVFIIASIVESRQHKNIAGPVQKIPKAALYSKMDAPTGPVQKIPKADELERRKQEVRQKVRESEAEKSKMPNKSSEVSMESAVASRRPSLSGLSYGEISSIESVCWEAKNQGPASYNRCLSEHLARLSGVPRPSLSGLSYGEISSIESVCWEAKNQGPASYNRCLSEHLSKLRR